MTTNPEWKQEWKGARVKGYRQLGRTGWKVSDIVLGTGRIRGEDGEQIARLAIDRGVNYFDTSPDYSGARQRAGDGARDPRRARPALHRHQVLHADGPPAAGHAGGEVHGRRRGEPRAPGHGLRRSVSRAFLRRGRAADGRERPRGLRPAQAAGQGPLPGLLDAHAEPGAGGEHRDRLRPLRRDDARLSPRAVAVDRRDHRARAARAGHGRRRHEDAEGREAQRARRLPRGGRRRIPRPRSSGCSRIRTSRAP